MNDQTKTPGAMVLMPRILAEKMLDGSASMGWSMAEDLRAVLAARAERTPAAGGSIAERIRAATIADSGQEGVNIAEGRFGKAMAALCLQLDGDAPAVGGEPVTLALLHLGDFDDGEYEDLDIEVRTTAAEALQQQMVTGREPVIVELIDRAHLAPLLAEIERLKEQLRTHERGVSHEK
ncbi:hypothetical protein ACTUVN_002623 [Pseudomonas caspiana]